METFQNIFRAKPSNYRLINYEAEVYKLIYGKNPPYDLELNYKRPKKINRGFYWDSMIDSSAIDELHNINQIKIIDLNQGRGSKLLTHCVFQTNNQDPDYVQKVSNKLNILNTKSKVGFGINNILLVYVAIKNWYREDADNTEFNNWWKNLPNKILLAVK